MTLRSLTERARQLVWETLSAEADPEVNRMLVAGAIVAREGEHHWIETGEESWAELEARARRTEGLCDCGGLLSLGPDRARCRTCGREFRA